LKRYQAISLSLVILIFALVACGQENKVGTEEALDFDEQGGAPRLGERSPEPDPTDAQGALGKESPTPAAPSPSATPERFFDIFLIADSPFYEAQEQGKPRQVSTQWTVPVGLTLRVTNEDDTDGRPTRTFTAKNGDFSSPRLKLGDQWSELKLSQPGFWSIEDACCPFITNIELTVQ
jgi:hypothetical protein